MRCRLYNAMYACSQLGHATLHALTSLHATMLGNSYVTGFGEVVKVLDMNIQFEVEVDGTFENYVTTYAA